MYGGFASGRMFLESDPIGLDGGQLSNYGYVDNNPISNIDPRGTGPVGAAIGGLLGGVGGFVGGTAVGAGGGTLVSPGVGTVVGGAEGAYIGTVAGALAGAAIGDSIEDQIMLMAKGGKQNISNEYSRAARNQKDPCGWLSDQYDNARKAGDSAAAQKIVQAQKDLGCRNKAKRCP